MNATNTTDTWSTMIEFDGACVNITDVDFTGSITPTNASWGHHVDYIYLGGTELTDVTGDHLLATLTVECDGSCGPVDLNLVGDENIERLIAGPPDKDPPRNGTIYSATWTNGSAQCRGDCGDIDNDGDIDMNDVVASYILAIVHPGYLWAADVDCDQDVDMNDVVNIYIRAIIDPTHILYCC